MDLDFYEVCFPSALIAFTDRSWSEVLSTLQTRACADVAEKISDYRVSEDVGYQYVMIAFNDQITNQCESLLFQVYHKGVKNIGDKIFLHFSPFQEANIPGQLTFQFCIILYH